MNIGMIVAIEMDSVFKHYPDMEKLPCPAGFELYKVEKGENTIYIAHTGVGEISAAAGVQFLCTGYQVSMIVNFGVVGGLTEDMKVRKTCVVENVVHYTFDVEHYLGTPVGQVIGHDSFLIPTDSELLEKVLEIEPDLMKVNCCSADIFVEKAEDKARLHRDFQGDVCDMESCGIILACEINEIPCLMLKAVSDGLAGGHKQFFEELEDAALDCMALTDRVLSSL